MFVKKHILFWTTQEIWNFSWNLEFLSWMVDVTFLQYDGSESLWMEPLHVLHNWPPH